MANFDPLELPFEQLSLPEDPVELVSLEELDDTSLCQIIRLIHNVDNVFALIQTSTRLRDLAYQCIERLDSTELVQIPCKYLANYQNLRTTKRIICQIFDQEDAVAIANMLNLTQASFLFPAGDNGLILLNKFFQAYQQPRSYISAVTGQLITDQRRSGDWQNFSFGVVANDLLVDAIVIGQDTALMPFKEINIKIIDKLLANISQQLIVQQKILRIVHIPTQSIPTQDITTLQSMSNIQWVSFNVTNLRRLHYLHDQIRQLISVADFGLVNPLAPPSSTNPPLISQLPILKHGLSSVTSLHKLMTIYIYKIKRLYIPTNRQFFHFDELMTQYFSSTVDQINKHYNLEGKQPLLMDLINFSELRVIANYSLVGRNTLFNYEDFNNLTTSLTAAILFDPQTYQEEQIIQNTWQIYQQARQNKQPYFLTDGSLVQPE